MCQLRRDLMGFIEMEIFKLKYFLECNETFQSTGFDPFQHVIATASFEQYACSFQLMKVENLPRWSHWHRGLKQLKVKFATKESDSVPYL